MRRLVDIAQIPEISECHDLQIDYEAAKNTLCRHHKSVTTLHTLAKDFKNKIDKFTDDLEGLLRFKKNKSKKRSAVDFYTIILEKVIENMAVEIKAISAIAQKAANDGRQINKKIMKSIEDTKKIYAEKSCYHKKMFQEYMTDVFPDTKGLLFKLHLIKDQKIIKRENPQRQQGMISQSQLYSMALSDFIASHRNLIEQSNDYAQQNIASLKENMLKLCGNLTSDLENLEIDQNEVEEFTTNLQEKEEKSRSKSRSRSKSHGRTTSQITTTNRTVKANTNPISRLEKNPKTFEETQDANYGADENANYTQNYGMDNIQANTYQNYQYDQGAQE